MKKVMIVVAIIFSILFVIYLWSNSQSKAKGLHDNQLAVCDQNMNAASSHPKSVGSLDPIKVTSKMTLAEIKNTVLKSLERTELIKEEGDYLHFECKTKLMRYVDDLELFYDKNSNHLHFRSVSRVGKSDLGVNKQRIETLRKAFK